ncbi:MULTISPECIES: NAD-dependent epimerase/dehydratase family protein [Arthrobacter]|uniref:NAD-dependent epimerase/dehydratase family protein n=2 Tax=Arthrobacter TaxID=1663 RepID=A0ABU9KI90_9MICC|nr:NAD-dependent epimerase/dehydratase family protein [Arthrobacter sp. YJM1]MDP5225644.1 NAD-dependent epimerase/dehydratase family protein [Arthrobacter sp. YJM1]
MRTAILGGTAFLSAELARQSVDAGHETHVLARGSTASPPQGVHWHRADREDGPDALAALEGEYDAVVDVTRQPHHAAWALEALADRAAHWTLVSSCSVYARHDVPGADESGQLLEPLAPLQPVASMEEYGQAKVRCELEVLEKAGERAHVSRPGLLVGPGDPSDRFGYWPARLSCGGRVLLPRGETSRVQYLDVRDYAAFLLKAAEAGATGIMNAAGTSRPWAAEVTEWLRLSGFDGETVTAEDSWLAEQGVEPWAGPDSLPVWLPAGYEGFMARSTAAAETAGLCQRPLSETWADTLEWEQAQGLDRERKAGLNSGTEERLLAHLG